MEKYTYAELLEFILANMHLNQNQIADELKIDSGLISRIKTGKAFTTYNLCIDNIYDKIFAKSQKDKKSIAEALKENIEDHGDRLNESITEKYNNYMNAAKEKEDTDLYKSFVIAVLEKIDSNANEANAAKAKKTKEKKRTKTAEQTNGLSEVSNIESEEIRFVKYNTRPISFFIGRDEVLKKIHDTLNRGATAILCGIGGQGKSFTARKYAEQYGKEYKQIHKVVFSTDMKTTVLNIQFSGLDERFLQSADDRMEKRMSILKTFGSDSLLIIDNMDTNLEGSDRAFYEKLRDMDLHILITTRETKIDNQSLTIPLEPLSEEEQLSVFQNYWHEELSSEIKSSCIKLLKMVDGHTLLIEMIAKTMQAGDLSPEEMLACLEKQNYDNVSNIDVEKDNTFHPQTKIDTFVSTLFTMSNLNSEEIIILMLLSLSDVDGIKRKLFGELRGVQNNNAVNVLIDKSWIMLEPGNGNKIHLHPIIKTAVKKNTKMSLANCRDYIENACSKLEQHKKTMDNQDKMALLSVLYSVGSEMEFSIGDMELLIKISKNLFDGFLFKESLKMIEKAKEIADGLLLPENFDLFYSLYSHLADCHTRVADYTKAREAYETISKVIEEHKINDREKEADTLRKTGDVCRKASKYKEALDFFTKAINIIDVYHVDDLHLRAEVINSMGVVYVNLDLYDRAKEQYEKSLEIRESMPEPDQSKLAYSYHNIGTVCQKQCKFDDALKYHIKALEIRKQICDANDPIIAGSLIMIGNDYTEGAQKNPDKYSFSEAEKYFTEGLKIRLKTLGDHHPDIAWAYFSIGKSVFYQKKYENAKEYFRNCLEIRISALRENHAYTGEAYQWLGKCHLALNEKAEALNKLNKALEIFIQCDKTTSAKEVREDIAKLDTCVD